MNIQVLDHIAEGRDALARAAKLAQEGSALAQREARAIREAQAMKSEAILKTHYRVRSMGCPSCGCLTLLPKKGRAWCINRHCAVQGRQRNWSFRELAFLGGGSPKRVSRTESKRPPRDAMDLRRLLAFFTQTGVPVTETTLRRLIKNYELPRWYNPLNHREHLYALSDVATVHAHHFAHTKKGECTGTANRPPCAGLHEMFFTAVADPEVEETAKGLCGTCPVRQVCLDTAMQYGQVQQHGIFGGLTAGERRQLKKGQAQGEVLF